MKLTYKCAQCDHTNKVKAFMVADRTQLAKLKGASFDMRCEKCAANQSVHVNQVKAENDLTIPVSLAIGAIGIPLTILSIVYSWGIVSHIICFIADATPVIMMKTERNKIHLFNFGRY